MLLSAQAVPRVRAETCKDGPQEGWDVVVVGGEGASTTTTASAVYTLARCVAHDVTTEGRWKGRAREPFNETKHAGVVTTMQVPFLRSLKSLV